MTPLPLFPLHIGDGLIKTKYEKNDLKYNKTDKIMNIILTKVKKSLIVKKVR